MEMWFDHTGVDERGIHRKRARPPARDDSAEINLTPMLDVVMIMLIFFIVAGTFVREVVVEVDRKATSSQESSQESGDIIVQIAADDQVWIRGRRIDLRAVRANLSRLRAENPKSALIIKAHNTSTTAVMVGVLNAAREAGIQAISLSNVGPSDA